MKNKECIKQKKVYIKTLGCPKNFNDSEGIAGICENAEMLLVSDPRKADIIIVNTCGFINDAKTESIDTVFDMIRLIEENCNISGNERQTLVVSGCLSQRYGKELAEEIPEVDLFIGVNDYESLPKILSEHENVNDKALRVIRREAPNCFEEFSARKLSNNPYTATLRIAEGCNNCCAYCVIPQIRGAYRSRPMKNILAEAEKLAAAGTKEIILIAQDVTEYGRDICGKSMLPELLRELCKIGGNDSSGDFKWIRLMYCYEDKITDELIEVMAEEEKICKYIDIPLQHVADSVLKAMKRRSTENSIKNTIARLRKAIPSIHIRTTFITGFPGETEADFEKLANFIEDTRFERMGVFTYSQEEGTAAGQMDNQIDENIKSERAESLMRHQIDISRNVNQAKIGKIMDVIVEEIDDYEKEKGEITYIGRTEYDAPEIDGNVIFKADGSFRQYKPGDFVKVKIEDAFDYDLAGIVVGEVKR